MVIIVGDVSDDLQKQIKNKIPDVNVVQKQCEKCKLGICGISAHAQRNRRNACFVQLIEYFSFPIYVREVTVIYGSAATRIYGSEIHGKLRKLAIEVSLLHVL